LAGGGKDSEAHSRVGDQLKDSVRELQDRLAQKTNNRKERVTGSEREPVPRGRVNNLQFQEDRGKLDTMSTKNWRTRRGKPRETNGGGVRGKRSSIRPREEKGERREKEATTMKLGRRRLRMVGLIRYTFNNNPRGIMGKGLTQRGAVSS